MSKSGDQSFATTQWTRVLAAKGETSESRAALSDLCEVYYAPVKAFIMHQINDGNRIDDLTQEFFARLLQRDSLSQLDRDRGKFRSYLLGAVKHFLADDFKHRNSQRAGGKSPHTQLEDKVAAPQADTPSDVVFDREWALALLIRSMDALVGNECAAGRQREFEQLKTLLTGDSGTRTQAEIAIELGLTKGAVKAAVHRLRKRFRETLRSEISQTVSSPDAVKEELRYMVEVLGNS